MFYELFPVAVVAVFECVVLLVLCSFCAKALQLTRTFLRDTHSGRSWPLCIRRMERCTAPCGLCTHPIFLLSPFPSRVFWVRGIFSFVVYFLHAFCMGIGSPSQGRENSLRPPACALVGALRKFHICFIFLQV